MSRERVDIRVEPDILEKLEEIAQRDGVSGGRSAAVREAIYQYVERNESSWNTDLLEVRLPKRLADRVNLFVKNGDARDADQAIVLALTKWCDALESYYISGREELENVVAQNIRNDAALDDARGRGKKLSRR